MSTSSTVVAGASVMVPLDRISTDEQGQTRVKVRANVVRDYAAAMAGQLGDGGVRFPPVVLFTDGGEYWLGGRVPPRAIFESCSSGDRQAVLKLQRG